MIENVIILFIIIILFFSKLNKCLVIFCHALCVLLYVSTPSCASPPCNLDVLK